MAACGYLGICVAEGGATVLMSSMVGSWDPESWDLGGEEIVGLRTGHVMVITRASGAISEYRHDHDASFGPHATGLVTVQGVQAMGYCGMSSAGRVRCWMDNIPGQVGDVDLLPPIVTMDRAVSLGVAATADGRVFAWDTAAGWSATSTPPVPLVATSVPLPAPAAMVAATIDQRCAASAGGDVWCWGRDLVPRPISFAD